MGTCPKSGRLATTSFGFEKQFPMSFVLISYVLSPHPLSDSHTRVSSYPRCRLSHLPRQNPVQPQVSSQRGTAFIQTLYAQNMTPLFSTWGSHRADFEFLERNIIYGLYLSDHEVLSEIEAEVVILTAIMCQGLKAPTIYHLRGLRRLGVSSEDVEALYVHFGFFF